MAADQHSDHPAPVGGEQLLLESGDAQARRQGIPGSDLPGPWAVGDYAEALRQRLRAFARVQLIGEVVNLRPPTRARVYFELRDARGALPCAVWREDWERLVAAAGPIADGMEIVVGGGCDYYPGSATSSPSFSFAVSDLRVAGEGDLLARIERLRRTLAAEGLLEPQKRLPRPPLPQTIGVITGETGKARDDVLAGLRRRGWGGRLVWGFAPVQDRHAAPLITRALGDLAALGSVDVIVVARGGGSLTDLLAFCDETLCRTVALLPVPVIASVGHHSDRTLLDDVAAVSCSTPTHAAEAAVPLHVGEEVEAAYERARRLAQHARRAVLDRARTLAAQVRAPAQHLERQRARLDQDARELRASSRRRLADAGALADRQLLVLGRRVGATEASLGRKRLQLGAAARQLADAGRLRQRRRELEQVALVLAAHDPQRTLERGYALVEDRAGELVTSARAASVKRRLRLRFGDGAVDAHTDGELVDAPGDGAPATGPASARIDR